MTENPPFSREPVRPRRARRAVALVVAGSMAVSACATTSTASGDCSANNPRLSSAELQMCRDGQVFNETVAGGVVAGAVAGALLGALAAALSSGRGRDAAAGAIVGAVAGGILGGVDGYITAKANEVGNNRVTMINSMAQDVEKDNQRLGRLVASSQKVLDDSRRRIEQVNADYQAGRATLAQLQEEQQRLQANRDRLQAWTQQAAEKRDKYVEAAETMRRKGASTAAMDAKIAQMNQEIAQLEQHVQGLNSALIIQRS